MTEELTGKATGQTVAFGCHCDLDDGQAPDGCVIDQGHRDWCTRAQRIDRKEDCDMWKPIATPPSPDAREAGGGVTESPKETMERLTRQFNQMSDLERAVMREFLREAGSGG